MDAIDLATLDDAPSRNLDPSMWAANLDALRLEQPDFAQELQRTTLPSHWRPVTALDGSPTWRVEPPGQPPLWLAETAAPQSRAAAQLPKQRFPDQNPALPSIAAGAELTLLLKLLLQQQAVFVFEQHHTQLAAVLRTADLARPIANGRCILIPHASERGFLEQLLERYPGLLPPTAIVSLPALEPQRFEQLRALCTAVAQQTSQARRRRLSDIKLPAVAETPVQQSSPRLALLALGPSPASYRLLAQVADAADQLGWSTTRRAADNPRNVHALPHCEALADFAPAFTICISHPPQKLPLLPGKPICQWHLRTRDVPAGLTTDDTVHLAASPRISDALRAAGVPDSRLKTFYWACPTMNAGPLASTPSNRPQPTSPGTVVILADLPDDTPSACGITQPTHKILWVHLHQTVIKAWDTPDIRQPNTLLRNSERASGISLGDPSLRLPLVRIIEHVLIPAVVLETISQRLRRESYEVLTIGKGWQRCSSKTLRPLADSLDQLPTGTAEQTPVAAAIVAGPLDPLSPDLFHAAGLGWPLLIHSPGRKPLTPQLGGIFHPQQHYEPFAGFKDLHAALQAIQSDPTAFQRRCDRLRNHLHTQHTYGHRLVLLAQELGFKWPRLNA